MHPDSWNAVEQNERWPSMATRRREEELWPGEPRHNSGRGKGDMFALSWVREDLQNNESHCDSVSTANKAHTVPPPVVQMSHAPSIPSTTCSEMVILPTATKWPHPQSSHVPSKGHVSWALRSWNCVIMMQLTIDLQIWMLKLKGYWWIH